MNILAIIASAAGIPVDRIKAIIQAGGDAVPDLKPEADALLAKIEDNLEDSDLLSLGTTVLGQLKDVAGGKFAPRRHRTDSI